ncbi:MULTISPECIES: RNA-directed DNA polymerase [unclassified Rhizobium]|uniref:RNA-directed DNA polymerase n=1 Tax=unclassified Rhizobium TaxID=2613769 RepID=UPI001618EC0E|nr:MULTISPECIES: RNA-directed DNA polymerase [unclassified Rhizobium]MBB3386654.1 retron-type reverse transcriptase [Rhizobium sp. BK098]MBB3618358.1 retron-type reverse transcriptase [Rhizobium sp. BK609]MBB3684015.1 retron-type reverse transcriptase [Rhizobium sp. BK612]
MSLSKSSIEWAIKFITEHADGDLFPRLLEIEAIRERASEFADLVLSKQLKDLPHGSHRRFIVPKDEISYRQATQLDPQDSVILSALIYQYGSHLENRRRPANQVFSYRFAPSMHNGLYDRETSWNDFWTTASSRARTAEKVLYCDISDFYNQIYHHVLENQLLASGLPNQAIKWIVSLMESTTAGVSRGVPIGPHAVHLLAEASLIPIDNSMHTLGIDFVRYADDIIIFADSEFAARRDLGRVAAILDKQQRLTLQRHKTRFFDRSDFIRYCAEMIEDRPINDEEDMLLRVVSRYSRGNPYQTISYEEILPQDWALFSEEVLRAVIEEYIQSDDIDFIRLRWFYRRLAQIGHPDAIDVTLENIEALVPCFASICAYLVSVQTIPPNQWRDIGSRLLKLLDEPEIKESEYFRLSILSIFTRNPHINHFSSLASRYGGSDASAKREILLAGAIGSATDWLRELKEGFDGMDPWQQRAFIYCCALLPEDEKKYFLNRVTPPRPFELVLSKWAKSARQ